MFSPIDTLGRWIRKMTTYTTVSLWIFCLTCTTLLLHTDFCQHQPFYVRHWSICTHTIYNNVLCECHLLRTCHLFLTSVNLGEPQQSCRVESYGNDSLSSQNNMPSHFIYSYFGSGSWDSKVQKDSNMEVLKYPAGWKWNNRLLPLYNRVY
jgi:hypothetical protein